MDTLTSYTKNMLQNNDDEYERISDTSMTSKASKAQAGMDMFARDNVENYSDPVKGKRYLWFTLIMVFFLTFTVYNNNTDLDSIAKGNIAQDKNSGTDLDFGGDSSSTSSETTKE
mgnify:CR=1 FL=1